MVSAGLERAGHRILQRYRRLPGERMDGLPRDRGGAGRTGRTLTHIAMNCGAMTGPSTSLALENSEVSPVGFLVAVAGTNSPSETAPRSVAKVKERLVFLLIVTCIVSRKVSPSPLPDLSAARLEKNRMVKSVLGMLSSLPWISVPANDSIAKVMTGKFCRRLALLARPARHG